VSERKIVSRVVLSHEDIKRIQDGPPFLERLYQEYVSTMGANIDHFARDFLTDEGYEEWKGIRDGLRQAQDEERQGRQAT